VVTGYRKLCSLSTEAPSGSQTEEKGEEKPDELPDNPARRLKENEGNEYEDTVTFDSLLCLFAHREERIGDLGAIEKGQGENVETADNDIPKDHHEEKPEEDARERSDHHFSEELEAFDETTVAGNNAEEPRENLELVAGRERYEPGEGCRRKHDEKIRRWSGECHLERSPLPVREVRRVVGHRFRVPERKACRDEEERDEDRANRVDVRERIERQSAEVLGRDIAEPQSHEPMGDLMNDDRVDKNGEVEDDQDEFVQHRVRLAGIMIPC
jgi:hypothetical protein